MANQRIDELTGQLRSADDNACEQAAIALGQQGQAGLAVLSRLLSDVRFWATWGSRYAAPDITGQGRDGSQRRWPGWEWGK